MKTWQLLGSCKHFDKSRSRNARDDVVKRTLEVRVRNTRYLREECLLLNIKGGYGFPNLSTWQLWTSCLSSVTIAILLCGGYKNAIHQFPSMIQRRLDGCTSDAARNGCLSTIRMSLNRLHRNFWLRERSIWMAEMCIYALLLEMDFVRQSLPYRQSNTQNRKTRWRVRFPVEQWDFRDISCVFWISIADKMWYVLQRMLPRTNVDVCPRYWPQTGCFPVRDCCHSDLLIPALLILLRNDVDQNENMANLRLSVTSRSLH